MIEAVKTRPYNSSRRKYESRIGESYGKLTIFDIVKIPFSRRVFSFLQCDCGAWCFRVIENVLNGHIKSCGCIKIKHQMAETRAYGNWANMKDRCHNPSNKNYKTYGGRGIFVCDRWRNSFKNFYSDMGEAPPNKTLDRFPDMDGPYSPENCRWATLKEQARNKRNTILTQELADKIRRLKAIGMKTKAISEFLGISIHNVKNVISLKCWLPDN